MTGQKLGDTYNRLCCHTKMSLEQLSDYIEFFKAVKSHAIENAPVKEEFYFWAHNDPKNNHFSGMLGREILTVLIGEEQERLSMESVAMQASKAHASIDMDSVILKSIFENDELWKLGAVAINISPESALSGKFWDNNQALIETRNPRKIIFEIVEYGELNGNTKRLEDIKQMGIRIALDDHFSVSKTQTPKEAFELHQKRIKIFEPHIIKFDGSAIITPALSNDYEMERLEKECTRLLKINPDFILLAEHVQNFEQASRLPEQINLFQGQNLTLQDYYHYIKKQEQDLFQQQYSTTHIQSLTNEEEPSTIEAIHLTH